MTVKVKCLLCDQVFSCDPINTSNLITHIQKDHPEVKLLTDDLVMQTSSVFGQVVEIPDEIIKKSSESLVKNSVANLSKISEESNENEYLEQLPQSIVSTRKERIEESESASRDFPLRRQKNVIKRISHLPRRETVTSLSLSSEIGGDKYIKSLQTSLENQDVLRAKIKEELLIKNSYQGNDETKIKKRISNSTERKSRSKNLIKVPSYLHHPQPELYKRSPSYSKYIQQLDNLEKERLEENEKEIEQLTTKYNSLPVSRSRSFKEMPLSSDENPSLRESRSVAGSDIDRVRRRRSHSRSRRKRHGHHHHHHHHHRRRKSSTRIREDPIIKNFDDKNVGRSVESLVRQNSNPCMQQCPTRKPFLRPKLIKASVKKWRTGRCSILCPKCGTKIRPLIQQSVEKYTSNPFGAACVLSCCWPCGFMPFLFPPAPKEYLYCSNCNYFFGVYDQKLGTITTDGGPIKYCERQ